MSLTHEQARALIIEREQAKAQAEAQPLQQALAEVERLRTLLCNARTVINQFLPNVGHCFGIDAQLLNETLIAIGTVVAVDPGKPGGDMTAIATFSVENCRTQFHSIEYREPEPSLFPMSLQFSPEEQRQLAERNAPPLTFNKLDDKSLRLRRLVDVLPDAEPVCPFCFARGCNGECHGDDMMGGD